MLIKVILVALLAIVIFNLFKALFVMIKSDGQNNMSQHLGRRLIFSVAILLLLLMAMTLGYIQPNPTPIG